MAAALISAAGGGSGKPRLATPDTGHLGAAEFDKVYEPVEVRSSPKVRRQGIRSLFDLPLTCGMFSL